MRFYLYTDCRSESVILSCRALRVAAMLLLPLGYYHGLGGLSCQRLHSTSRFDFEYVQRAYRTFALRPYEHSRQTRDIRTAVSFVRRIVQVVTSELATLFVAQY